MKRSSALHIADQELDAVIDRLLSGPQHPDKVFVQPATTFCELYTMAAGFRAYFKSQVDEPFVCLCALNKTVVAAALLASLAGGPALILPYALTPAVFSDLHRLTGVRHAIVDSRRPLPEEIHAVLPQAQGHVWTTPEAGAVKQPCAEWLRIFTGGSTGAPKMWTKTARNLLSETLSIIRHYDVNGADRCVATVSPNHIYGLLYSILTPLLASAAVAAQTPSFPGEIEQTVLESQATVLISVPAHYRALNGHPFAPPNLRLAFSSAGMLAAEDAEAFSSQTGVPVAEIYGSTETGGIAERVRARGEDTFKPYDTIDVRIAGERLKVRSDYLSPGLELQTDGFFTVGDRARWVDDGRFELLGRTDGIVKVGGRRVDLESVRQALKKVPGIREALAISLPVGRGRENQVVAVVEGDAQTADVNRLLGDLLEPYARPRSIKRVEKIPMTAAGKFDRKGIEKLFQTGDAQ